MHADLNFKLVRIIYTLREKKTPKNVCKHVVESYTICLWPFSDLRLLITSLVSSIVS